MLNFIHSHIPEQDIIFKPYSQVFHSFYDNDGKHNYYISPEFGKLTRIIGENVVLEGFEILETSNTIDSVSITVNKGRTIINDTYIEIKDLDTITFDQLNKFDDSGFVVLSLSFINLNTIKKNQLRYHLTYFDKNYVSYGEFNHDRDKVILGLFSFEKDESNNIINFDIVDLETIILDGVSYVIRNQKKLKMGILMDGGVIMDSINCVEGLFQSI